MKIDVIIPAYNAGETIDYLLASIAMQRLNEGDSYKVTIVDDCSTDGTDYDAIAEYWSLMMDVNVVHKAVNAGCGQARQTGVDSTDGDYIVFADADDSFVTPFALAALKSQMTDADMAMGVFVEMSGNGIYQHGENYTWCHGKMYRRSFLKENNLRFNLTRGNEDVGFNSLLSKLTSRIVYFPQVLYCWNNQQNSLVRKDRDGYACGYGWRDFLENIAWSCEEQMKRYVPAETTAKFASEMTARFFFQFADSLAHKPDEWELSVAKLKDFYNRAVSPFAKTGLITLNSLQEGYYAVVETDCTLAIPRMTYRQFLEMLGFFEDEKIAEALSMGGEIINNGDNSE